MKTHLIRLALVAGLSIAATAAQANYYCVTSKVTARSGPGTNYGSVGVLNPGNRIYGLWSVGGWRKVARPSGGVYFVPSSAIVAGACPAPKTRAPVVYAAPKHHSGCGGCSGRKGYGH